MININWVDIIQKDIETIIAKGIETYKEAKENRNFRYILELNEEGDVYYWYDIAGGNSFHVSTFNGTSIELAHLCFQYEEYVITDEAIKEKLKDLGQGHRIKELETEAEEREESLEKVVLEHDDLPEIISLCIQDEINFDISEYSREYIENAIDRAMIPYS